MTTTPFIETVETRVRTADPAAGGHGRGLGDPDEFQGEVPVGSLRGDFEFGRQLVMLGHRDAPF
jgi:hypothetical protein